MARTPPSHVERSFRTMNLHLIDIGDCIEDSWPVLGPSHAVPDGLTVFLPSQADRHGSEFAHFFIEDYRFERLWKEPERYVSVLSKYAGMIMPDFSTYRNMPIPMQMWNAYRNKALAAYYQMQGIEVIPSLMWSDERSFDWIFDGMPIGGTYAVGATGYDETPENKHGFYQGLFEAVRCLKPDVLLCCGRKLNLHLPCEMIYYPSDNINRVRSSERSVRGEALRREMAEKKAEREQPIAEVVQEAANATVRRLFGKNIH